MRALTGGSSPASPPPASTAARSAPCARRGARTAASSRHAAQAESAGFRPCLRCRPELAPQALAWSVQDASGILVRQAVQLLDAPEAWDAPEALRRRMPPVARLAQRLGVSDRHLRRIFEAL